eukprot:1597226-Pleurochrysis_carterae.AAC.9
MYRSATAQSVGVCERAALAGGHLHIYLVSLKRICTACGSNHPTRSKLSPNLRITVLVHAFLRFAFALLPLKLDCARVMKYSNYLSGHGP